MCWRLAKRWGQVVALEAAELLASWQILVHSPLNNFSNRLLRTPARKPKKALI